MEQRINWRVRIRNKQFWLAIIPATLLLIQAVAALFSFTIDLSGVHGRLVAIINAVFVMLTILGVVTDPTTAGVGDSMQAMGYDEPRRG